MRSELTIGAPPPQRRKYFSGVIVMRRELLLAKEGRSEAYYADQTRRFLEAQWSRMTLKIIRR